MPAGPAVDDVSTWLGCPTVGHSRSLFAEQPTCERGAWFSPSAMGLERARGRVPNITFKAVRVLRSALISFLVVF